MKMATDKFVFLGSTAIDLLKGELKPATDGNPHHRNIDGNCVGLLGAKVVVENIALTDIEQRTYANRETFYLVRHDRNRDYDKATVPASTLNYYKAIEQRNLQLEMQVATMRQQMYDLKGKQRQQRHELGEAKHQADLSKLKWSYNSGYGDFDTSRILPWRRP